MCLFLQKSCDVDIFLFFCLRFLLFILTLLRFFHIPPFSFFFPFLLASTPPALPTPFSCSSHLLFLLLLPLYLLFLLLLSFLICLLLLLLLPLSLLPPCYFPSSSLFHTPFSSSSLPRLPSPQRHLLREIWHDFSSAPRIQEKLVFPSQQEGRR